MFGEGKAMGTVPLASGQGVNVTMTWIGPGVPGTTRPESRGAEHLTVRAERNVGGAGRTRTLHAQTGAEFESGQRLREGNDEDVARMNARNAAAAAAAAAADGAQPQSPERPPPAAAASPHRSPRVAQQQQEAEERGSEHEPWLGKAARLDDVGKLIISHYQHKIISE
eukprot:6138262-Prymnesium_polylepis.1